MRYGTRTSARHDLRADLSTTSSPKTLRAFVKHGRSRMVASSVPHYIKPLVNKAIAEHRRPNGDVDIKSAVYTVVEMLTEEQRLNFFGPDGYKPLAGIRDQDAVKGALLSIDDEICRQLGIPAFDNRN